MELNLKAIAVVESCYKDRFAIPRQPLLVEDSWAFLKFNKQVQPELSLQGLEEFSHLWVIFGFHLNKTSHFHAKVHPPRLNGETMGLFATRTPHRPNPLGLSLVKIKKASKEGIEVYGADLADGTPVYDIKPYLPEVESIPSALSGWVGRASKNGMSVKFLNAEIKERYSQWSEAINQPQLIKIIMQTLENDPRPKIYMNPASGYRTDHVFQLFNGDIHFREVEGEFVIFDLQLLESL